MRRLGVFSLTLMITLTILVEPMLGPFVVKLASVSSLIARSENQPVFAKALKGHFFSSADLLSLISILLAPDGF